MHKFVRSLVSVVGAALVIWGTNANATTTFFKFIVNNDTSATTEVQGDTLGWLCNCGIGDSVRFEYYLDLNVNHTIDTTDMFLASWYTRDGDSVPKMGSYDVNPTPDGMIICPGNRDGTAPGNYCVKAVDEDSSSAQDYLTVTPIPSPLATVSGTVTVQGVTPPNNVLKNMMIGAFKKSPPLESWASLTDSLGNYTINFGTSGVLFDIGTWFEFPGYHMEGDTELLVTGNITGIDFYFSVAVEEKSQTANKPFLKLTPNLVSNKATIEYMLGKNENVSLKLYDITGKAVQTLTNEYRTSGLHTTELTTNTMPSGIYFVTLQTQSYKTTQKLILTK
ncbi:MAG: T9SS type A sorting domain-containing protein [bacterium]|nr:T9SS type A sorting domain-containing protein [bacterium]